MPISDDVCILPEEYQKYLENDEEDKTAISPKMNLLKIITDKAKMKMEPEIKDSSFIPFLGQRRSGKSLTAIAMAHIITNGEITTENVVFSFDELKDALNNKMKTALIWDEAGVTAYNRDFMTNSNKIINKTLQVFGFKRLAILATVQHLNYIDSQLRGQADALLWNYGKMFIDKSGRPYTRKSVFPFSVKSNPFWAVTYKPYEYITPKMMNPKPMGWIPLPELDAFYEYAGVKKEFLKDYDKKKHEFFETIGEDSEPQKVDMRILKTAEKQHSALKAALKYMNETDKLSKEAIAKKVGVARSTLRQWQVFEKN